MDRILRGTFQIGNNPEAEEAKNNWIRLTEYDLEFNDEEDLKIFKYLTSYYDQMSAPPDFLLMKEYFENEDDVETVSRLEELSSSQVHIRTNYLSIIKAEQQKQLTKAMVILCRDATTIAEHGKNIEKKDKQKLVLKGPNDAANFLFENLAYFTKIESGTKLEGVISEDAEEVFDQYEFAEKNKAFLHRNLFGLDAVDEACKGHKRGEFWIHTAFTGELKCLSGSSEIYDHSSKKIRTLEELYETQDMPVLTSLYKEGKELRLLPAKASHIVQNGTRPVFELVLSSGKKVLSTDNHKFLTVEGWKELKNISSGEYVATPKRFSIDDYNDSFSDDEIKIIGYLLGDGTVANYVDFTASNEEIRNDFSQCLTNLGYKEGPFDGINPNFKVKFPDNRAPGIRVSNSRGNGNTDVVSPIKILLDKLKLTGCIASTKHVPAELFGIPDHQISLLLGALWSTDGSIHVKDHERKTRKSLSKRNDIKYYSISEKLCLDVQTLLLRLGIRSTVKSNKVIWKNEEKTVYVTRVVGKKSKLDFVDQVCVVGKDYKLDLVTNRVRDKNDTPYPTSILPDNQKARIGTGKYRFSCQIKNRETISEDVLKYFSHIPDVKKHLESDLLWERVVSVSYVRNEMTYDLEVPEHHSFIVNNVITHNTTLALNYAYNNSMVYGKNIFYAILEMPYDQLRRQLYVIHSSHGKFVTEWHKEDGYTGLNYIQVRDGMLNKRDKERYRIIANDFKESCKGKLFVWRPKAGTGIQDIARKAEMFHNRWGCDGVVIDHLGLVKTRSIRDYVVAINEVVQESRQVALDFARGQGVPLLALFQMNRQGKIRADKSDGHYDMSAISYANECLIGSTLIPTDRGLIQIQDVKPGKDQVWSRTGWKQVLDLFNNGKRKVFEVTDSRGFSVTATEDHRLRTIKDGVVSWTSVKDLTPDSFLLSGFNRDFPVEFPPLPEPMIDRLDRITNKRKDITKMSIDEFTDLAYFMGISCSDGVFKQKFNIEEAFTVGWKDSKKIGIPDIILRSPVSIVCCFLRGLYDIDGCISNQGVLSIKLKIKHKITLQQVQILFSGLGIDSVLCDEIGVSNKEKVSLCCLRIRSRESREKFCRLIGFTDPSKMKRLETIVNSTKSSTKSNDRTLWPIGTMFHRICKKYKKSDLPRKVRSISKDRDLIPHGALISLISFMKEKNDEEAEFLHDIVNTSRPSKLKSVISAGTAEVFDIEVTGDHEYESAGLLSHNCEKSADVITYTYLNDMLRKDGKFYLGNLKNREGPIFDRMVGKILWHSKRMRSIESNVITLDNAEILAASKEIAGLSIQDLLAG